MVPKNLPPASNFLGFARQIRLQRVEISLGTPPEVVILSSDWFPTGSIFIFDTHTQTRFLIFGLWLKELLISDLNIGFLMKKCRNRPLAKTLCLHGSSRYFLAGF